MHARNQCLRLIVAIIIVTLVSSILAGCAPKGDTASKKPSGKPVLRILSSSENKELVPLVDEYTKSQDFDVEFAFKGSIDSMSELTSNAAAYDAVWLANSQWIALGDKDKKVKNQKSIMNSPVVWGIKLSVAERLGFTGGKDVTVQQLADAVQQKKLTFAMTSASQSNSGASAYIGFLYALLGNPQTLTAGDLHKPELAGRIKSLLAGVNRSSGSSEWLKDLFLQGDYDAMVNYEAVLIATNKSLVAAGKEPLYLVYPVNGLTVADYALGYIHNGKPEQEVRFKKLQDYLLSEPAQKQLAALGRRTGYGGVMANADPAVFNPRWGIDAKKVLSPIPFPEPEVMLEALQLYQSTFKKPSYTVFCIDYSGSMAGNGGEKGVKAAMELLLTQEKAKASLLQSSAEDIIVVIPFNSKSLDVWTASGPNQFPALLDKIKSLSPSGGTDIYEPAAKALDLLKDIDQDRYVTSVVLMTDGESQGSFKTLKSKYDAVRKDIPVFSITFGDAKESQLKDIAKLTRADVFPSGNDLTASFKKVRGYN